MDYTKNNNNGVVYKLAKRGLKSNKGRNIAAVITIALSVWVVLSLVLSVLSVNQINYDLVKDTYQAIIRDVDDEEIRGFEGDSRLYKVGAAYYLDYTQTSDGDIFYMYYNDAMIEALANVVIEGVYPKNEDEILVSQSYLDMTGQNANIGDLIEISVGEIEQSVFKITGVVDDTAWQDNMFYLFFSKPFLERFVGGDTIEYTSYLWLENVHNFTADEAQQLLTQVCEDNGIEAEQISFNSPYFHYIGKSLSSSDLLSFLLIGGLILFAAAIVVYTVFYISVGNKIREYGQLRTLGATKKQIKRIVSYEGMTLTVIGGAAGVLLGWIVGYALRPDGWNWVSTLWATLAVVVFVLIVVWVSVRTPAKLGGSASPIEAGRYSAYTKSTRKAKTKYKKSSPLRIAVLNVVRSPKKAVLTILSLGLCGVLFICAMSLDKNITAKNILRSSSSGFLYGEYKLEVISGENNTFSEVQQLNNPLNEELRQQILAINGVEGIHEWKAIHGTIAGTGQVAMSNQTVNIYGYAPQDEEKLTNALIKGTGDYEELSQNNGLIVCSPGTAKDIYGWEPQLGDTIRLTTLAGNGEYIETMLTVMGITDNTDGFSEIFRMTDSALQKITGTACSDSWEIVIASSNDSAAEIEQHLTTLLQDNPYIQLQTFSATVEERQAELDTGWGMIFILALLLGVFGIVNLINTNSTNMFTRIQEIGILQAVGMTGKQMRISLMSEGLINTFAATLITVAVGFPFGYMACFLVNETITTTVYSIPWQAALLYFSALLIAQLLLTVYDVWTLSKIPVIERVNVAA